MASPFFAIEVALLALITIPLLVLGIFSARQIKQHGDRIRRGFYWFHNALWLFFFATLFNLISVAVFMARYSDSPSNDYYFRSSTPSDGTLTGMHRVAITSSLLLVWSYTSLLVCACQLAVGAKLAATQGAAPSKKFSIYIWVVTGLASLLWFITFCARQYGIDNAWTTTTSVLELLGFAAIALLTLVSLSIFIFSLVARTAIKKQGPGLLKASNQLAIISGINMVVFGWAIVSFLFVGLMYRTNSNAGPWIIGDVVMAHGAPFVSLVFLYFLGKKKEGGLWSGQDTVDGEFVPLKDMGNKPDGHFDTRVGV